MAKFERLAKLGCGILRFAVPISVRGLLGEMARCPPLLLFADIHFDGVRSALPGFSIPSTVNRAYRLVPSGGDCPKAKGQGGGYLLRIGVNGGSLPQDLAPRRIYPGPWFLPRTGDGDLGITGISGLPGIHEVQR